MERAQLLGRDAHAGDETAEGGALELDEAGGEERLRRVGAVVDAETDRFCMEQVGDFDQVEQHVHLVAEPAERARDAGRRRDGDRLGQLLLQQLQLAERARAERFRQLDANRSVHKHDAVAASDRGGEPRRVVKDELTRGAQHAMLVGQVGRRAVARARTRRVCALERAHARFQLVGWQRRAAKLLKELGVRVDVVGGLEGCAHAQGAEERRVGQ
eukprot:1446475-Pleurochrysis_carterae.AAC.1